MIDDGSVCGRTRDEFRDKMRSVKIPAHMHDTMLRYVFERRDPGDFLTAALSNDLFASVHQADEQNLAALKAWLGLFHWEIPGSAWGTRERVREWIAGGASFTESLGESDLERDAAQDLRVALGDRGWPAREDDLTGYGSGE